MIARTSGGHRRRSRHTGDTRAATPLRPAALVLLLAGALASAGCGRRADVGPVVASTIGDEPSLAGLSRGSLSFSDRLLTDAVAQGLVRFDATGQVEAGLAERWIVTDEGRSYIFRLRRATWDDGTPVRASEIVTLLRRQVMSRSGQNRLAPYLTAIRSIVEMTPEVIEIELDRPRPDLLKLFAQPELALVRARDPIGAGPMRVARVERGSLLLTPVPSPDRSPDEEGPAPEDNVRLIAEPAARAIIRFVERQSDLVAGGGLSDWPLVQAARPAPANLRIDPAAGLFGLAIVRREGFLAGVEERAAVTQAFDRAALVSAFSVEWPARETILPEQLDSSAQPALGAWAQIPAEQRRAAARARVAVWRAANGGAAPTLRLALPLGAGGTLLWGQLAADLYAVGIRPVRVAPDDESADLRLIDKVAPHDSARWYLAEACVLCSEEAQAALEAARLAPSLAERATAIAAADQLMAADLAFVPLARPFRWSLVALRLQQWQANARAWHPLNRLRNATN